MMHNQASGPTLVTQGGLWFTELEINGNNEPSNRQRWDTSNLHITRVETNLQILSHCISVYPPNKTDKMVKLYCGYKNDKNTRYK